MDNTTSIALSRLVAQQRALDVSAGNLANANTSGFHAERLMFSDWLVDTRRGAAPGAMAPRGAAAMTFTQDRATYRNPSSGPLTRTGDPLDLAISGSGYFTVSGPNGPRLTRAGHFEVSQTGEVVDARGDALLDTGGQPIRLSPTDTQITVAADGTIGSQNGQIGRIGVVDVADTSRLTAEGGWVYSTTAPTTPAASPGVVQGAVEASNVQPTTELVTMMGDLREFQFTTQLVQAEADRQQSAIDKLLQKR